MQSLVKSLLRPIPIIGISGVCLYLTASLSTTSTRKAAMVSSTSYRAEPYTPRHTSWPYSPSPDFTRQYSSPDTSFYTSPRFVTHIDDAAIVSLREYYDSVLPRKGKILDFCSSWVSHYPPSIEQAVQRGELQVTGMGMNKAELDANALLNNGRVLWISTLIQTLRHPFPTPHQVLNSMPQPASYQSTTSPPPLPPSPACEPQPNQAGLYIWSSATAAFRRKL